MLLPVERLCKYVINKNSDNKDAEPKIRGTIKYFSIPGAGGGELTLNLPIMVIGL